MTSYVPEYEAADISKVVIDLLVGIGAGLFSFVSLIALVFLYNWLTGKM